MKSLRAAVMTAIIIAQHAGAADTAPDAIHRYKTVGDRALHIHVFHPPGHRDADRRPAILFFSGGGWKNQDPAQFHAHARYLASRGMVAMAAEYRTENADGTSPFECVADAKSAMRWARSRAVSLGIDPDRLAAGGGSAGGHMAAATAMVGGFDDPADDLSVSPRPAALVLFNPVIDNGPDGFAHQRVQPHWRAFSPMHNIGSGLPPAIVFLGTEDPLIPVATAEAFRDGLIAGGARCELHLYEGQPHAFFNYRGGRNPYYFKTVIAMDRFLASLGYLEGEPTLREP